MKNLCVLPLSRLLLIAAALAGLTLVTMYGRGYVVADTDRMKAAYASINHEQQQLEDDLKLAAHAGKHLTPPTIDRLLAPVDRLQITGLMQRQAVAYRLQHFSYALTPEPTTLPGMMRQQLSLSADIALDTDAYAFMERLRQTLPGRVEIRHLVMEKIAAGDNALSTANLHMTATCVWLSNNATVSGSGG